MSKKRPLLVKLVRILPVRMAAVIVFILWALCLWIPLALAISEVAGYFREVIGSEWRDYKSVAVKAWRALLTGERQ